MSWAEIKRAVNSTLGTDEFNALDKIIKNGLDDNFYEICSVLSDVSEFGENLLVVPKDNIITDNKYKNYDCIRAIIPNGIKTIGDNAFHSCGYLRSITIPDSVTSIGEGAFYNCSSLTSVEIPDSVTSIGGGAFYNCSALKNAKIGKGLTIIPGSMFFDCQNLSEVVIKEGATNIDLNAFGQCYSLKKIVLPKTLIEVGRYAFSSTDLEDVYFTGTEEQWNNIVIAEGNSWLTDATIHYNYISD